MSIDRRDSVYVNGAFIPAITSNRMADVNPTTGAVFAEVPACGVEDVDRAVAAARNAFDAGPWPTISGKDRAEVLQRLALALESRAEALKAMVIAECGFSTIMSELAHVAGAIGILRYNAELARLDAFEEVRPSGGANVTVRRCPVGVVAAIVPWNIPLNGALAKIGPALAAGCTVVYQPSPESPMIAYLLAEAVDEAGFPAGAINILPAALEGSRRLVSHPDVDMVSFTGSTAVGRQIAQACATDFRRVALELGGNAAAIILEDAPVDLMGDLVFAALVQNNGEACIAQRRILAPRSRYDEIVGIFAAAAQSLKVGDPADPSTVIGPLITEKHRDRMLAYIRDAVETGAVVAAGGKIPAGLETGYFVEPTVLTGVTNDTRAVREEVFGPLISVLPYDTVEEAIVIAKDTEYGLSSSVWTADLAKAEEIGRRLRVGSLYINGTLASMGPSIPFGGFAHSGVGREMGPEGLDAYCEVQSLFIPVQA
ncbi:aldehyde dehydrogenase family protein [Streptomyces sp. NPDC102279]|uniref:aldehyde dehydrogenase family protein n=1 Tax=Streptomyces sp. NPDC102279 TaxID=3366153 RepID=UPI003806E2BA